MNEKIERLLALKKEKDAVILAHYYVDDEVQEIADYVGDSYYLAQVATQTSARTILLCGVLFMAESAKILNPTKKVLIPDRYADCPMAHMASVDKVLEIREQYPEAAVVCYVNSSTELKAQADVCVTSSNALRIVRALPQKQIYFIPDENLGRFIAAQCPEKEFIFNDGFCHVHAYITADMVKKAKAAKPNARVLVHPECTAEVTALADFVGSTSEIIKQAGVYEEKELLIGTEIGVIHELKKRYPDKIIYTAGNLQICPNMKKITLDKVITTLEKETPEITVEEEQAALAKVSLDRMLELAQ